MNANNPPANIANPTWISAYRAEMYRWLRSSFYRGMFIPGIFTGVLTLFTYGLSMVQRPYNIDVSRSMVMTAALDLGVTGAFALSNQIVLYRFAEMIGLAFVLGMVWHIGQEFQWRTLKMIATRQPSRTEFVLVKVLAGATLLLGMGLSFIAGWLLLAVGLKLFSGSLALTAADADAIGKGLAYFAKWLFAMFVWGLFALPFLFRFKSVIGAALVYVGYSTIENTLSLFAARIANADLSQVGGVTRALWEFARAVNPYLITTNINALTGEQVVQFGVPLPNAITPLEGFARLCVWAVILLVIAITIYRARDITE